MSVLIRGMKMPENCVGCPLAKNYGMCAITKKTFNWEILIGCLTVHSLRFCRMGD